LPRVGLGQRFKFTKPGADQGDALVELLDAVASLDSEPAVSVFVEAANADEQSVTFAVPFPGVLPNWNLRFGAIGIGRIGHPALGKKDSAKPVIDHHDRLGADAEGVGYTFTVGLNVGFLAFELGAVFERYDLSGGRLGGRRRGVAREAGRQNYQYVEYSIAKPFRISSVHELCSRKMPHGGAADFYCCPLDRVVKSNSVNQPIRDG
jgi:hypothetical protein